MEKKLLTIIGMNSLLVALILGLNFIYLKGTSLYVSINLIAAFIFAFPIIMIKYMEYRRVKQIEESFPTFLRDFVGSIRGGMTVPHAFKSVSGNDYGALSPYTKKMSAQLDWGMPVEKILLRFSKEVKSKLISRIISSVIESHRFGGNLADTFEALSNTALEIDRLREERKLYLHSQMITGYIVFFVFLFVIIGLGKFLVPSLTQPLEIGVAGGGVVAPPVDIQEQYRAVFRNLILIQGLFAGVAVGKMAEGAMVAGLKHSLFMMFVGTLIFTLIG